VSSKRKITNYVPSVLPVVEVAAEGASYNPSLSSYLEYTQKIAKEETRLEDAEKQTAKFFKLTEYEKSLALQQAFNDNASILGLDDPLELKDEKVEPEDSANEFSDVESMKSFTKKTPRQRTLREKRDRKLRKLASHKLTVKQDAKRRLKQFNNLKSIEKDVKSVVESTAMKIQLRKDQRAVKNLTQRKRLGRGKYAKFEEPVLLVGELGGNLRTVKAQGNVLQERLKSLQKRNILPVPGARPRRTLKLRLKAKVVEKRSTKEITKGSKVI